MKHLTLGLLSSSLLLACTEKVAPYEEVRPVRTTQVAQAVDVIGAKYSGEVRARHEAQLGFRIAGQVQERMVELGQQVKAGQALLRIDGKDVALQQSAARSQFERTSMDYDRAKALRSQGFVSQTNVDAAKVARDAAEAQYKLSSNQGGYTVLRAERAGVVTALAAEVGQVVAAGSPVVKIAEDGAREVVVSVPESRVKEFKQAGKLEVSLWADSGKRYAGRLRELAPDTDPVTRTYAARISIEGADADLRLGMTASVHLPGQAAEAAFTLPLTAIYDNDGRTRVWLVDPKESRVHSQLVKLAGVRNDVVRISEGLRGGETVVTAGAHLLHENQKVRLAQSQLARQ